MLHIIKLLNKPKAAVLNTGIGEKCIIAYIDIFVLIRQYLRKTGSN